MWTTVGIEDLEQLQAWLNVMLPMDPGYADLTVDDLVAAIELTQAKILYYQGGDFQIAMRYAYDPRREQWQWVNLGFVGDVTPAEVLDLATDRFAQFLSDQQLSFVTAVVPKQIAYEPLMELYGLAEDSLRLDITILFETEAATVWQIEYAGD